MIFVWMILGLLLFIYIGSLVGAYCAFRRNDMVQNNLEYALEVSSCRHYKKEILAARDWLREQEPEEFSTFSYDNLRLMADYLPTDNARGTILLFHGWRGGTVADFGLSLPLYQKLGLNILLVHERAQGKSAGRLMTFGIKERRDVHTWVNWYNDRFGSDTPLLIGGLSMGAATVLMACGQSFPENVKGVLADCGFTTPKDIIRSVGKSLHLPTALLVPLVDLHARVFGGFGLTEYSTLTAMKQTTLPILLIHGEKDLFVPCEMSKLNYAACNSEDKTLLLVPDAGHGQSYPKAPEQYAETVTAFVERCLERDTEAPNGGCKSKETEK